MPANSLSVSLRGATESRNSSEREKSGSGSASRSTLLVVDWNDGWNDHAGVHRIVTIEYSHNFPRFDAHATYLDLFVEASQYLECAIRLIAATVARPVEKIIRLISERILDEARPMFFCCVDVAQRAEGCANHYLTRLANTAETVGAAQHQRLCFRQGPAHRLNTERRLVWHHKEAFGQRC